MPLPPSFLSLFRSNLRSKRFVDPTLRMLEPILAAKDVTTLVEAREAVKEVLRSEAVAALREVAGKEVDERLNVAQFFVRAFALVGDVESCLALKYEALVLRELKHRNDPSLQVSYQEWLTFAEDSFGYGFHSIAVKGFDCALLCIQSLHRDSVLFDEEIFKKIMHHRDIASALVASHSVQTQTAEYLKRKSSQEEQKKKTSLTSTPNLASSMYRNGIKKRNIYSLRKRQAQGQFQSCPTSLTK